MAGRTRTGAVACFAAVVGLAVGVGCSDDDDSPSDELLRIEGPAEVDPSFEGIDGRQP